MKWDVSFETKCQGMDLSIQDQYHAISFPIYQTATFSRSRLGEESGFDYTRQSNPTRSQLESVMAGLENAEHAIAFSSGMAAISAVMNLFEPGDHIIVDIDLYGGSVRLFDSVCRKSGIDFTTADISTEDVSEYIKENTKAVYLETPTNPMMHVTDNDDIAEKLRLTVTTTGAGLSPFDSWLILRGIRTLAVRMDRAEYNAKKIADYLAGSPYVTKVIYPGLPGHPGHEIMKKQARGFGSMISFEVRSKDFAVSVLNNVELFYFAESLGGTETLITYPITQTHAAVPKELLDKNGINDRLLRLSVGIEGAEDLIGEIERVFKIAAKK